MNLMEGKTGLIMGVANERSIAWGIANELFLNKANIILTYQNDSLKKRIEPLSEKINCNSSDSYTHQTLPTKTKV